MKYQVYRVQSKPYRPRTMNASEKIEMELRKLETKIKKLDGEDDAFEKTI